MPSQPLTATTTPLRNEQPPAPFEMSPQQLSLFKNPLTMHQRCEHYDATGPGTPVNGGGSDSPGRSPAG